jgi:pre-mRNA-processing factor 19
LITIKSAPGIVRPRPPSATSIPALLASFQNEWDAVMLETFELRLKYRDARQELTGALYNHDAACRVIARLSRERDEARNALANVKESLGAAQQVEADGMDVDRPQASSAQQQEGITDEIIEKMAEVSAK